MTRETENNMLLRRRSHIRENLEAGSILPPKTMFVYAHYRAASNQYYLGINPTDDFANVKFVPFPFAMGSFANFYFHYTGSKWFFIQITNNGSETIGKHYESTDMENWELVRTLHLPESVDNSIVYVNGVYAFGGGGTYDKFSYYSTDGINWTEEQRWSYHAVFDQYGRNLVWFATGNTYSFNRYSYGLVGWTDTDLMSGETWNNLSCTSRHNGRVAFWFGSTNKLYIMGNGIVTQVYDLSDTPCSSSNRSRQYYNVCLSDKGVYLAYFCASYGYTDYQHAVFYKLLGDNNVERISDVKLIGIKQNDNQFINLLTPRELKDVGEPFWYDNGYFYIVGEYTAFDGSLRYCNSIHRSADLVTWEMIFDHERPAEGYYGLALDIVHAK